MSNALGSRERFGALGVLFCPIASGAKQNISPRRHTTRKQKINQGLRETTLNPGSCCFPPGGLSPCQRRLAPVHPFPSQRPCPYSESCPPSSSTCPMCALLQCGSGKRSEKKKVSMSGGDSSSSSRGANPVLTLHVHSPLHASPRCLGKVFA